MRRISYFGILVLTSCVAHEPSRATHPAQQHSTASEDAQTPERAPTEVAQDTQPQHPQHAHQRQSSGGGKGYGMDFSEVDRFAKHFDDPARDAWQNPKLVIHHLQAAPGQTVADIGAGTGYFIPYLAEAVGPSGHVLALDVEPNMVEHIKRRVGETGLQNVKAAQVAEDDPALPEASVDRVLIVNTWHHISGRSSYAVKLAKALKPSGSVLIVDFTSESDIGPPHQHRLTPQQVSEELRTAGLQTEIIEPEQLPKQYLVRARRAR